MNLIIIDIDISGGSCNMDSMWSDSTLGIPKEILAIWLPLMANLTVKLYGRLPNTKVATV